MKVSVITPVYNVAKYLPRCIDSVLNQTFKDFELILVDGGSIDGSAEICDEYASKDPRVKAFHQTHDNVPKARNRGVKESEGEYLAFVDSDDYVLPQFLEHLVAEADRNSDVDLVAMGFFDALKTRRVEHRADYRVFSLEEFKENFTNLIGVTAVWAKIYKCSAIGDLRFDEKSPMGEDALFNLYFYPRCKKIAYLPYAEYIYEMENVGSATHVFKEIYIPCYRKVYIERKLFLCGEVKCTSDWSDQIFCDEQMDLIQNICCQKAPIRQKKAQMGKVLEDNLSQTVFLGKYGFPLRRRMVQRLCRRKRYNSLIVLFWIKKRLDAFRKD